MNTLKFKTNIKCGSCVAAVSNDLNGNTKIKHWEVDLQDPNKVLTVEAEHLEAAEIIEDLKSIGYKAEAL